MKKKSKATWWIVSGRLHGQDDDSVIPVKGVTQGDAVRAFTREVYEGSFLEGYTDFDEYWDLSRKNELHYEQDEIYIIHVIKCGEREPRVVL